MDLAELVTTAKTKHINSHMPQGRNVSAPKFISSHQQRIVEYPVNCC